MKDLVFLKFCIAHPGEWNRVMRNRFVGRGARELIWLLSHILLLVMY